MKYGGRLAKGNSQLARTVTARWMTSTSDHTQKPTDLEKMKLEKKDDANDLSPAVTSRADSVWATSVQQETDTHP